VTVTVSGNIGAAPSATNRPVFQAKTSALYSFTVEG